MKLEIDAEHAAFIQRAVDQGFADTPEAYVAQLIDHASDVPPNQNHIESMIAAGMKGPSEEIPPATSTTSGKN